MDQILVILITMLIFLYLINSKETFINSSYKPSNPKSGLVFVIYDEYMGDNNNFVKNLLPTTKSKDKSFTGTVISIPNINDGTKKIVPNDNSWDKYSVIWEGYFKPDVTGIWTFYTNSDDGSYLWIGDNAKNNFLIENALINNGGAHGMQEKSGKITLTKDIYYYFRVIFGEMGGGDNMILSFSKPGNNDKITDGSNYFYYEDSMKYMFPLISTLTPKDPKNGLVFIIYDGYMGDSNNFVKNLLPTTKSKDKSFAGIVKSISSINDGTNKIIPSDNSWEAYSVAWGGYFKPDVTGNWTFYISSDDGSYLWIGDNAKNNFLIENATINNGGAHGMQEKYNQVNLTKDTYYYFRIIFGEIGGGDNMVLSFSKPGSNDKLTDGSNYFYYEDSMKSMFPLVSTLIPKDPKSGLVFVIYDEYMGDNNNFVKNLLPTTKSKDKSFTGIIKSIPSINDGTNKIVPSDNSWEKYSVAWEGYFKPDITGIWTFYTSSDDGSYLWIGDNAKNNFLIENALINNGGAHGMQEKSGKITLMKDIYYYFRVIFGEIGGGDNMIVSFSKPGSNNKITEGSNYFYYEDSMKYMLPLVSASAPIVSMQPPIVSESAPIVSMQPPIVSESAPIVSESAPIVSMQPPIVSESAPIVSMQPPIVSMQPPIVSEPAPIVSMQPPIVQNTTLLSVVPEQVSIVLPPVVQVPDNSSKGMSTFTIILIIMFILGLIGGGVYFMMSSST